MSCTILCMTCTSRGLIITSWLFSKYSSPGKQHGLTSIAMIIDWMMNLYLVHQQLIHRITKVHEMIWFKYFSELHLEGIIIFSANNTDSHRKFCWLVGIEKRIESIQTKGRLKHFVRVPNSFPSTFYSKN